MLRDRWIALLIALGTSLGYFLASRWIGTTGVFWHYDLLFDVDTPRVVQDLTCADCPRHRTITHPALVLLLNPVGSALRSLVDAPLAVAQAMTALAGGGFAGVFHLVLRSRGLGSGAAAAGALVLAGGASHVAMASIPETSIFSGLAGLVYLVAVLRNWPRATRIGIGVVAASMVVTHLMLPLVFAALLPAARPRWRGPVVDMACVALGIVALALVQRFVHPSSIPFFLPQEVLAEREHVVAVSGVGDVLRRIGWILQNLFQFPVVAPGITEFAGAHPDRYYITLDATRPWQHGWLGPLVLLLWIGLGVRAAVDWFRDRDPLRTSLLFAIAAMAVILLPYSDRVFLFSPLWSAWVVLFVLAGSGGRRRTGTLWALAILNLIHSTVFLGSIVDAYQGRF